MSLSGKTAVVTGAGRGIGRAIAQQLAMEGLTVCVVDRDLDAAKVVAKKFGGMALACDVGEIADLERMVSEAQEALGQIDMLVSNAGYVKGAPATPLEASEDHWAKSWDVNVMAHVRASRLLLPGMIERGEGWLVNVASAAGFLHQIGDAPYSATKHAAVSHAQSLAIEHGDQGIRVSVVCPLYVATGLLGYDEEDLSDRPHDRVLSAAEVAEATIQGVKDGRFLILPHAEATTHFQRRAKDTDRWIDGMRQLRRKVFAEGMPTSLAEIHRKI